MTDILSILYQKYNILIVEACRKVYNVKQVSALRWDQDDLATGWMQANVDYIGGDKDVL